MTTRLLIVPEGILPLLRVVAGRWLVFHELFGSWRRFKRGPWLKMADGDSQS